MVPEELETQNNRRESAESPDLNEGYDEGGEGPRRCDALGIDAPILGLTYFQEAGLDQPKATN